MPVEPVMPRTTDYFVYRINCPGVSIYAMRQWDGEVTKEYNTINIVGQRGVLQYIK